MLKVGQKQTSVALNGARIDAVVSMTLRLLIL